MAETTIQAYRASEHSLEENIEHAYELADRLHGQVIAKHAYESDLMINASALSIALRQISVRYRREQSGGT